MFHGHDRQSYEELKVGIKKITSFLREDVCSMIFGVILLFVTIILLSFCGCVNKSTIDLDTCTREKLLNCVSSHRIETSSEAIGLVMACQRDVCMGRNSRCQK